MEMPNTGKLPALYTSTTLTETCHNRLPGPKSTRIDFCTHYVNTDVCTCMWIYVCQHVGILMERGVD